MCDCYKGGGPFIAEDPECPVHGAGSVLFDEKDEAIQKLRGQLQNCVNHLEGIKRRFPSMGDRVNPCIESANKALYETLGA